MTTKHLSTMSRSSSGSAGRRVLLEAHVLDFVEKRAIADAQHLGGLHAVPAALLERMGDDVPLGLQHGAPRDLLERESAADREGVGGGRGRRGGRRCSEDGG